MEDIETYSGSHDIDKIKAIKTLKDLIEMIETEDIFPIKIHTKYEYRETADSIQGKTGGWKQWVCCGNYIIKFDFWRM